ncbi:antibiotic biosynthesis monooxygenase [Aquibium carbonis]|uniref:Antibiotic biosynthesis monooxygenase n=1 Tax=Aquibium carbonis TaxID=2495581 RepID=A0A3R9YB69_9HYPH|nr:antibiotic biosynthesis monooxygenase [Aquibium carbonis]RST88338.1 antibiotic biosynthesis monooxygenase [Aquibium carbonis]
MITLTAIIRCKPGSEDRVRAALVEVGAFVAANEPGTISFYVTEGETGGVFATHERFADREAMDAHNAGAGSKGFFAATDGLLDGVDVVIGREISSRD